MSEKIKKNLNVLLNLCLFLAILGITYSWMLTEPSEGELVDYDKKLVIVSTDISVVTYALIDNEYIEQTISPMYLGLLAPGEYQRYRFDITNTNNYFAETKIVFSNITGDIVDLSEAVIFGVMGEEISEIKLGEKTLYNEVTEQYYFNFIDRLRIPANDTLSLLWYIKIDEDAENEIADKQLEIDKIMFINP